MQKPPYPVVDDAMLLPEVQATPAGEREVAARIAVAALRRDRLPDRRTWTAEDPAPSGSPWVLGVIDGDGALWRAKPGIDVWTLEEPPAAKGTGEKFTWEELLTEFGPLTEPWADWCPQRMEVVDAIRAAAAVMDDLLFHELGAYVVGSEVHGGRTTEHSPDTEIIRRAGSWANCLREQAERLTEAVSRATLLQANPASDD
ncbi:hypothetical protein [Streptomyces sp. NPDC001100]